MPLDGRVSGPGSQQDGAETGAQQVARETSCSYVCLPGESGDEPMFSQQSSLQADSSLWIVENHTNVFASPS